MFGKMAQSRAIQNYRQLRELYKLTPWLMLQKRPAQAKILLNLQLKRLNQSVFNVKHRSTQSTTMATCRANAAICASGTSSRVI